MIVIITKSLCYHQVYVADDLYKFFGDDFFFIEMREPLPWRVSCNQEGFSRPYAVSFTNQKTKATKLIKEADVIIFGEAPLKVVCKRKKTCLLFKMSETIFKDTYEPLSMLGRIKRRFSYAFLKMMTNNSHSFLLSCSAFAYNDYYKLGVFRNRALKWGYFPKIEETKFCEIENKFSNTTVEIVWASRLIKYKNPDYCIKLANYLIKQKITNFHITIIGDSSESDFDYLSYLKNQVTYSKINNYVSFLGKITPDEVIGFYKKANIALFTADSSEGWSVGVNEALSCGCGVLATNVIGCAPFLLNEKCGLIFDINSLDDFFSKAETLILNQEYTKEIAHNGFLKIINIWNHYNASKQLAEFINSYLNDGEILKKKDGPCSVAKLINYDWYKE